MKTQSLYQDTLLNHRSNDANYSRVTTLPNQTSSPLLQQREPQSLSRQSFKNPPANGCAGGVKTNGTTPSANGKSKSPLLLEGLQIEDGRVISTESSNMSAGSAAGLSWRTRCILLGIGTSAFLILLAAIAIIAVLIYFSPRIEDDKDMFIINDTARIRFIMGGSKGSNNAQMIFDDPQYPPSMMLSSCYHPNCYQAH